MSDHGCGTGKAPEATSSLVRRLVYAKYDPAKERVRQWLIDIDDQRLLEFGLTPEDIAVLRRAPALTSTDCNRLQQTNPKT